MTVSRRTLLAAAPAALAPAVAAGGAAAQQAVRMRMTTVVPEVTTIYQGMAVRFADTARRLSGGAVEIQPFPVGVIAPAPGVFDAVTDGLADVGHAPLPLWVNRFPETGLFSSFPGGLGAEGLMHWMYRGGGLDLLVEYMHSRHRLHPLVVGFSTTELFAHSHVRLQRLADFQGVKFRALGLFADILREMGAAPVATPTTEVVPALTQRVIDAAEFFPPSDNLALGLHRVARYAVTPGVHLPGGYFVAFMRLDRWTALPEATRDALTRAAELASFESWLEVGAKDIEAMRAMAADPDVEIVRLDDEVVAAVRGKARDWARRTAEAEEAKGNPWVRRVMEAHFGFQDAWDAFGYYRL